MLEAWNPYPLPPLPAPLARLDDLAYNLWWTWEPDAEAVFETLHPELWHEVHQNPIRLLRNVSARRLELKARDPEYIAHVHRAAAGLDAYLESVASPLSGPRVDGRPSRIAYFSAEFGVHESLPIYSGGLGVLAGDVCKAASDLNVPLVAVGLLYPQGYFDQTVDDAGQQGAAYAKLNLSDVPIRPAIVGGRPVIVEVSIAARPTRAQVWWVNVGRVSLFLLDTDIPTNMPEDREVGYKLYGGGPGVRLRQEMVLGIGGVRALRRIGIRPEVWHLNEGHAAFATLELCRELVTEGYSFEEARRQVAASTVFTTHTPVRAGHDEFSDEYILAHFDGYAPQLGIREEHLLQLARHPGSDTGFSMTTLAFRLADRSNAVSRRHEEVSREMWRDLWPGQPPIDAVTNGVHRKSWLAPEVAGLLADAGVDLSAVRSSLTQLDLADLDGTGLWHVHRGLRGRLIDLARDKERRRRLRLERPASDVATAGQMFDPDALTVVWARRFATYKRALLIFRDPDRLARILTNPDRPVQLLFAGKAHPADAPGQAMLQQVYRFSRDPAFQERILFFEGYDIAAARAMVAGADVWLNTPMAPQEASGTSGQKAALNGAPNLSILDGWWAEGFTGANGWAIGAGETYAGETSDVQEAESLYQHLEQDVVPLFYDRQNGLPMGWIAMMRASIAVALAQFTAERMVADYLDKMYAPAKSFPGS